MAIADLWLAILLGGVGVFVMSSIIHMALHWHKGDYSKMPGEEEVLATMREHGLKSGQYMFPCPDSMKDMQSPEMQAKYEKGPVGFMNVLPPGGWAMGSSLLIWFIYSIVISAFVAYVLTLSLKPEAAYMDVFRLACTVSIMAYCLPAIVDSIWKGARWAVTFRFMLDGLLYALVTAGVFAWQWPKG